MSTNMSTNTHLEVLVLEATHELLQGQPDWSKNLHIVDTLNAQPALIPAALTIIQTRFKHRKNDIALAALSLLETVVKNVPKSHTFIGTSAFVHALLETVPERVLSPKRQYGLSAFGADTVGDDGERSDKVLSLIQNWAKAFNGTTIGRPFQEAYRKLISNGVSMPKPSKEEEAAPVMTPPPKTSAQNFKRSDGITEGFFDTSKLNNAMMRSTVDTCSLLTDMLISADENTDLRGDDVISDLISMIVEKQKQIMRKLQSNSDEFNDQLRQEEIHTNDVCASVITYYNELFSGKVQRGSIPKFLQQQQQLRQESIKPPSTSSENPACGVDLLSFGTIQAPSSAKHESIPRAGHATITNQSAVTSSSTRTVPRLLAPPKATKPHDDFEMAITEHTKVAASSNLHSTGSDRFESNNYESDLFSFADPPKQGSGSVASNKPSSIDGGSSTSSVKNGDPFDTLLSMSQPPSTAPHQQNVRMADASNNVHGLSAELADLDIGLR